MVPSSSPPVSVPSSPFFCVCAAVPPPAATSVTVFRPAAFPRLVHFPARGALFFAVAHRPPAANASVALCPGGFFFLPEGLNTSITQLLPSPRHLFAYCSLWLCLKTILGVFLDRSGSACVIPPTWSHFHARISDIARRHRKTRTRPPVKLYFLRHWTQNTKETTTHRLCETAA